MKYKEAAELANRLTSNTDNNSYRYSANFMMGYRRGMGDIIRALCTKGVIDNSDELKREMEGGF